MKEHYTLFNFGRSNRLFWSGVCLDSDHRIIAGWWLNGRIFGRIVNVFWRRKAHHGQ